MFHPGNRMRAPALAAAVMAVLLALTGCGGDEKKEESSGGSGPTISAPQLSMAFPDSLTGGTAVVTASNGGRHPLAGGSFNCDFIGNGSDEPFDNGYHMTKFLVGIIATWQCISDDIMLNVSQLGFLATGQIYTIGDSPGGSEPTALSITLDSATQTTVRLYYDFQTITPSIFLSWNTVGADTTGKLVINTAPMQSNPDDPSHMRMDFSVSAAQRIGDMYIYFQTHPTVTGFRIQVTEALDGSSPTFTALGRVETKAQWDTDFATGSGRSEKPVLTMYTVSDSAGVGAADALFTDVGWGVNFGLLLPGVGDGHFGYYLYDKDDRYFFSGTGTSQWVDKVISNATMAAGTHANVVPDNTTIRTALGIADSQYFEVNPKCSAVPDDCLAFVQAVYSAAGGGWAGQEPNGGSDPLDWRHDIMAGIDGTDMLTTVLPTGATGWGDVFAMTFTQ